MTKSPAFVQQYKVWLAYVPTRLRLCCSDVPWRTGKWSSCFSMSYEFRKFCLMYAWMLLSICLCLHDINWSLFFQWYDDASNCGFAMWVDLEPIPPIRSYIDYLESRIKSLESDLPALAPKGRNEELVISLNNDNWCSDPYCSCAHHKGGHARTPGLRFNAGGFSRH